MLRKIPARRGPPAGQVHSTGKDGVCVSRTGTCRRHAEQTHLPGLQFQWGHPFTAARQHRPSTRARRSLSQCTWYNYASCVDTLHVGATRPVPGISTISELQHRLLVPTAHSLQGDDMSSEIDFLTPRQQNNVLSRETDGHWAMPGMPQGRQTSLRPGRCGAVTSSGGRETDAVFVSWPHLISLPCGDDHCRGAWFDAVGVVCQSGHTGEPISGWLGKATDRFWSKTLSSGREMFSRVPAKPEHPRVHPGCSGLY